MTAVYIHLTHENYKRLEEEMIAFNETVHTTTEGFYHKSIRLHIDDNTVMEFHGPLVKAVEYEEGAPF